MTGKDTAADVREKVDAVLGRPGVPAASGAVRIARATVHHIELPWSAGAELVVGNTLVVVHAGRRVPHRARTNAVLLPHVIRYNGTVPTKLTGWPKYENYRAPERFQDIARTLGLPAAHPQEGVSASTSAPSQGPVRTGEPAATARPRSGGRPRVAGRRARP